VEPEHPIAAQINQRNMEAVVDHDSTSNDAQLSLNKPLDSKFRLVNVSIVYFVLALGPAAHLSTLARAAKHRERSKISV